MEFEIVRESITIPSGDGSMGAHLVRPQAPGRYPGVVVGFEIFGLTAHIRDVAERIARLGYTVIVPDFYHRAGTGIDFTDDPDGRLKGLELSGGLTREGAVEDIRAAVDHLRGAELAAPSVGMIGFSFGGHLAYLAATQFDLAATAVFYAGWLASSDIGLGRPGPTLTLTEGIAEHGGRLAFFVGDEDHAVPAADRAAIGARLAEAGVRHEIIVYPGIPHGFFCDVRDSYRKEAADDAWIRVQELFAAELPRPA
ncbi:dienelactone hydrolase family protein [Streptomyces sp. SID13666]|uniref:dienelactone hydrolase family protein n=1 Tax=unclassified Streptomyces TaxID=2593676 RepID=UPI0013C1A8D5|nr:MULTISPECIES: dienelactone hydrolase family protein [unclassified Streptomyces]NEA57577.1 dienelactone hydrolase family protein [Streptomyces sp. SID13666]NEA70919.1 dienelactone hydrolase family protein [Streptomyces sp. SID13588]